MCNVLSFPDSASKIQEEIIALCLYRLKELADQVGSSSIIRTIPCDLMDMGSVRRAAEQVREAVESYGGLDILANNAGNVR